VRDLQETCTKSNVTRLKFTSRGEKQGECKILENTLEWGYEVFKGNPEWGTPGLMLIGDVTDIFAILGFTVRILEPWTLENFMAELFFFLYHAIKKYSQSENRKAVVYSTVLQLAIQ